MIGKWQLSDLQSEFGGELTNNADFSGVSIDSRSLQKNDLFIAIKGPNFDGHNFINAAVDAGAAAVVVSQSVNAAVPQWVVADTRTALAQVSLANRNRFKGKLYAITGSSGKTTVKEMLYSILAQEIPVLATKGNLNNDIGVPLTLLALTDLHQAAVIEQGAGNKGEIAYTTKLSLPDIAVLNNVMPAHLEGFGSLQAIADSKAEIFSKLKQTKGTAIINYDDDFADYWLEKLGEQPHLGFGCNSDKAEIKALELTPDNQGCYGFRLQSPTGCSSVQLSLMGKHNVYNALAATAAAIAAKIPLSQIVAGLNNFEAVSGRMQVQQTSAGTRIVDDSYNANPGSMFAAIELLAGLLGESILVMGDMAELGKDEIWLHREVGRQAADKKINRLWAVGTLAQYAVATYKECGGEHGCHFKSKQALIAELKDILKPETVVLIKGSRSAAMEQIVSCLISEG